MYKKKYTIELEYQCFNEEHNTFYCANCAEQNRLCLYDNQPLTLENADELQKAVEKYYGEDLV